jgi:hypothetical protein
MKYGQKKLLLKLANVENTSKKEDYGKGVATIGGAAASGAAMTRFLPMNSSFAKAHPTLRGALYAGGLSAGGLLTRAGVDTYRTMLSDAPKEASNMPSFLSQDRPEKVKEIYRALKREHPEYSAGKKARIANAMGKLGSARDNLNFYEDDKNLYHVLGPGVSFAIPKGPRAEEYKKTVEKEHGWVGSTRPTDSSDNLNQRAALAISRTLDRNNPNRPRYASLKDFILRRPDPRYRPGAEVKKLESPEKQAEVEYRGKTFPGYNQPVDSDRPEKKKMVLAKKGDQVKLIHFGQKGYKHNYSDAAKKNYLTRSAGIRGKDGNLTANDKFSANYWARRELWPKNEPADGSARNREKRASDVSIPEGGLRPGLLMNDLTQVMTPEDAQLVRDRLPFYERSGPGLLPVAAIGAGSGALLGHSRGAVAGGLLLPAIAYYGSASGKYDQQALQAARAAIEKAREKRASDDDFGHKAELAGLGILAAPYAAHLGAKVPGLRRAAGPVSELLHKNHSIEHAVELGGLGVLAAPSLKHYIDKRKQAKKE